MPTKTTEFKGLPVKAGKLVEKGGKFTLTVGATKKALPAGIIDETQLAKVVGDVNVAMSGRNIVAIFPKKPPFRCVLCYLPGPDLIKEIRTSIRDQITQELLANKLVNQEFVDTFR